MSPSPTLEAPRAVGTTGGGVPADPGASTLPATAYLVLLVLVPSVFVVGPLGAAGTPAGLVGLLLLVLWVFARVTRARPDLGTTAVHWLVLLFVSGLLAAVTSAAARPMSALETNSMVRGVIVVLGWAGVALFLADCARGRLRLFSVVRLLVGLGTVLALLGLFQFATGFDFIAQLSVPGLSRNASASLYERAGFHRVNATAIHSIEFAAVLAMILPLAATEALRLRTRTALLQALLIAGAMPLTVARSGIIGLAVGLLFTFVVVPRRIRWLMVALSPVAVGGFVVASPGLLGTLRDLFLAAGSDTSITARTGDYPAVEAFVSEVPWLGRGPFTFLPSIYRTLDNQYLGSVVEGGLLGLAVLLALLGGAVLLAARVAVLSEPGPDRLLAAALATGVAVAALLFLTFDAFSFPMAMGVLFVLIGLIGAASATVRPPVPPAGAGRGASLAERASVVVVSASVLLAGAAHVSVAVPSYEARGSIALAVPPRPGQNIFYGKLEITGVTDLVHQVMQSPRERARLVQLGAGDYQVAVGTGSLAPNTEVVGYGDVMWVGTSGSTVAEAQARAALVRDELVAELHALQSERGVDPTYEVAAVESFTTAEVVELPVRRSIGLATAAVLAGLAALTLSAVLRRLRGRLS
ncbi:hypothetical protein GB931_16245 [Modestobacter sp. I12A-02628]|uniref:O-antigen ligase family protein n=1 Tax=Goekera deserti TaxID=2497753 RepID=A0A7K3WGN4_9ACTN|nr:O-antigen ligase family protein [Goekera deserti]MPQ99439.1 hypothetical protein [Goekera deserti]NDI48926.1 hypothetical protein [Goekera deserti]NEL55604.1 O-antigen ligase family protein [Goekera deserti]